MYLYFILQGKVCDWCQCGWLFRRPRYALNQTKRYLWILVLRKSF